MGDSDEEAVLAEASLRRTWLAEYTPEMKLAMTQRWDDESREVEVQPMELSTVDLDTNPNVRGWTGQARQYDNTLQRTATPPDYGPPPPKAARRKTSCLQSPRLARGGEG